MQMNRKTKMEEGEKKKRDFSRFSPLRIPQTLLLIESAVKAAVGSPWGGGAYILHFFSLFPPPHEIMLRKQEDVKRKTRDKRGRRGRKRGGEEGNHSQSHNIIMEIIQWP